MPWNAPIVGTGPAWTAQDHAGYQVGERCFHAERQEAQGMAEEPESSSTRFLVTALLDGGIVCIRSDDPKVKAVDYEALRQSFYERFVVGGDAGAKQDSGRT
jgi:hypothetical protein